MNVYTCRALSKKDLPQLLLGDVDRSAVRVTRDARNVDPATSDEIVAIWAVDPKKVRAPPVALVIGSGRASFGSVARELIAWLWTYSAEIRPITATTRILSPDLLQMAANSEEHPNVGPAGDAWVGAMLGEALLYSEERSRGTRIGPNTILGTSTFVQARAVALGYGSLSTDHLLDLWRSARVSLRQMELPTGSEDFSAPWEALRRFTDKGGDHTSTPKVEESLSFVKALEEYSDEQALSSDTLFRLSEGALGRSASLFGERMSREDQVREYQEALRLVYSGGVRSEGLSFALAYQLNLIGLGSMDHIGLLSELRAEMPSAYLWYGLLAGLTRVGSNRLAFEGPGRRVTRELLRSESPFEYPQTDIDLLELSVAAESSRWEQIRSGSAGVLSVGLLPGVATMIRGRPDDRSTSETSAQYGAEAAVRDEQVRHDLREVEIAMNQARHSLDRLARTLGTDRASQARLTRSGKKK